jgi:hypothetical protein
MRTRLTIRIIIAAVALGVAAHAIGELTINKPADGEAVKPDQVVVIGWRNMTTNPIDVWLKWDGKRKKLGEYGNAVDGEIRWRVPEMEAGTYTLLVEEAGGLGASSQVEVVVSGAPARPEVYAAPNPLDLSSGAGEATFNGIPAGARVMIYDMVGREVATVEGDPPVWNGRNENGELAAAGTYLFVVDLPGGRYTGKIAVIK